MVLGATSGDLKDDGRRDFSLSGDGGAVGRKNSFAPWKEGILSFRGWKASHGLGPT